MGNALAGRHIVISGGAKGIGAATVRRCLAEGARVGVIDRDAAALATLKDAFDTANLFTAVADVCVPAAIATAVTTASRMLGRIDGLVNAAGIDLVADIETMALDDWNRVISVNLTGPVLLMQACYPFLKAAGGGTIVNVSSAAGLSPLQHRTAYCASKAGLQMASKALALEAAGFGIRINTICPGAVETDLFRSSIDAAPDPDAAYDTVRARYALKRIADPDEIAAAILWLTSSESSYVTGTAIAVDGGRTFY